MTSSTNLDENCQPETCPHRHSVEPDGGDEVARCALLEQISGIATHPALSVRRDACAACCESFPSTEHDLNPVLASLLFELTEKVIEEQGTEGCNIDRAKELNTWAERSLPAVGFEEDDCSDIARISYAHVSDVTTEKIASILPRPEETDDTPNRKVRSWAVGITTAPRRLPTLERCTKSTISAGWSDPVLFVDGDVHIPGEFAGLEVCHRMPARGAFPNYVLSLAELYMRSPEADAYMMIQDDAVFLETSAVRDYLESVLWPSKGPSIASLYCSKKYNQEAPGWHIFPSNWIWGAVAFVFSSEAVRKFLTSPLVYAHRRLPNDEGLSRIDVLIGKFASANDVSVIFPSPSLVQHIGTISTIWNVARAVNARHANEFIGDLI